MVTLFREAVDRLLTPVLAQRGFRVLADQRGGGFGDELIVFDSADLRLRVVRDRGQVFADFGSPADPHRFFDSGVVMEFLGLGESGSLHREDSAESLAAIARFVTAMGDELRSAFSPSRYGMSVEKLDATERDRAERRFGSL